eukprot:8674796-Lingulodinium_polyedra.AAC.1
MGTQYGTLLVGERGDLGLHHSVHTVLRFCLKNDADGQRKIQLRKAKSQRKAGNSPASARRPKGVQQQAM